MIAVKTESGFTMELDEATLDNQELLDAFADLSSGNTLAMSQIVTQLLGKENKKRLYDHLRTPDGRVPITAVEKEVGELMRSIGAGKNSASSPN